MLRLASSSPTIRAIATSRILSASFVNSLTASHHNKSTTPYFISHNLSTDAINSTDHKLNVPAAPADFPFTIVKKDNCKEKVYLTRDLNGEKIEVLVLMPNIIREDLSATADDGNSIEHGDDVSSSESGVCLPEPLELSVRIEKEERKEVYIGVTMCPHVMQANVMSVVVAPQSGNRMVGLGIHDVEGEELKCAVGEYLKIRGIRSSYAEFLYRYMVWKSKVGPLEMMEEMKKFIKD